MDILILKWADNASSFTLFNFGDRSKLGGKPENCSKMAVNGDFSEKRAIFDPANINKTAKQYETRKF